jgi:hypothetical protein
LAPTLRFSVIPLGDAYIKSVGSQDPCDTLFAGLSVPQSTGPALNSMGACGNGSVLLVCQPLAAFLVRLRFGEVVALGEVTAQLF